MTTPRTCAAEGCDALIPAEARSDRITCSTNCRKAVSRAKAAPDRPERPARSSQDQPRPKLANNCRCGGHAFEDADGDIRCLKCGRTTVAPEEPAERTGSIRLAMAVLMEAAS